MLPAEASLGETLRTQFSVCNPSNWTRGGLVVKGAESQHPPLLLVGFYHVLRTFSKVHYHYRETYKWRSMYILLYVYTHTHTERDFDNMIWSSQFIAGQTEVKRSTVTSLKATQVVLGRVMAIVSASQLQITSNSALPTDESYGPAESTQTYAKGRRNQGQMRLIQYFTWRLWKKWYYLY